MKKKKSVLSNEERVEQILNLLSKENPTVRMEVVNTLPAYNSLLNLNAKTFEEFALRSLVKHTTLDTNDILFDYRSVIPPCPKCKKASHVGHRGRNTYWCKQCEFKFKPHYNSIAYGTKESSVVWRKVLHCMMEFYSIKRTCKYCKITPTTFYNIRNKIFYSMELITNEIKLYGTIQCDNTMAHLSFKGTELQTESYPEDSPFQSIELAPRKARKRGGSYSNEDKIKNQICIFTAIDDNDHVLARMVGVGAATGKKLFETVGSLKFLYTVPETDPFSVTGQQQTNVNAGAPSLLVADGETAIKKYAEKIGINYESHVYRRNGKQVRLAKNAHDIQKVNSLHSRLDAYLRKLNYVSSKYLPGYLTLFEFIENTKDENGDVPEQAIGYLFEILSKPGLGKSPEFFAHMFETPKAQIEKEIKRAIKKAKASMPTMPTNTIKALFLYDMYINQKSKELSLQYISDITHCPIEEIMRLHTDITSSGDELSKNLFCPKDSQAFKSYSNISSDYLTYYDEYFEIMKKPLPKQISLNAFVDMANKKYNKNYKSKSIRYYFGQIVQLGLREPLPKKVNKKHITDRSVKVQEKHLALYQEAEDIRIQYKSRGENITRDKIFEELALKYNRSKHTIAKKYSTGKQVHDRLKETLDTPAC